MSLICAFLFLKFFSNSNLQACQGVDGIFHLAGLVTHSRLPENSKKVYETNLLGTMNVLKAAHTQKYSYFIISSFYVFVLIKLSSFFNVNIGSSELFMRLRQE